ncbi:MAG TPA: class IV adenylate cyclase [Terriglobia bacterium]|nr:class IV adenylate cyclase [Terriglobia bacterium]
MRREIEVKLPVHDARAVRRRLAEMGFRQVARRSLERNALFDFRGRRLRKAGSLLRLRLERGRSLLTFKGPRVGAGRFKERPEIEAGVSDGDETARMLEALGLRVAFRYEKYRTLYRRREDPGHTEAAFDETPIGIYLELEGPRAWIDKVARGLGYRQRDYITASYGRLYLGWCEAHGRTPGDMLFPATGREGARGA